MTWTRAVRSAILPSRTAFNALTRDLLGSAPASGLVVGHVLLVVVVRLPERRAIEHDADDGRARALEDFLGPEKIARARGPRVDHEDNAVRRGGDVQVVRYEQD